jgi:hypothetical protein
MLNQLVPVEALQGLWELLGCGMAVLAGCWFWLFPAR